MSTLDADIDRLYQLPLGEFTAARNDLAKRAGDRRADVKALQKPNTAAWAVNQLYWQRRTVFDRLTAAAERLRVAHARVLSGGRADVRAAERAHADALQAAEREARALLSAASERASAAIANDIHDTLEALPSDEPPGRLVRPIAPMGFAGLLKMLPDAADGGQARPTLVRARPAATSSQAARAAREAREARRAEADRKRARRELERRVRDARAAERERDAALTVAREALARAEREERHRQKALEEQRFEVRRLTAEVESNEQQAQSAADARRALEAELAEISVG